MKHVTLKHVSEAAGVSVQTVSQILNPRYNDLFHPDTRARVVRVANELGYRPSAAARAMLSRRSNIIGVLVPIRPGGWFFQLDVFETMLGMNQRLAHEGYVTSVIPVAEIENEGGMSRAFRERMLDGLVVIGWVPDSVAAMIEEVAPVCIWCDTSVHRKTGCIRRDEFGAGTLAAEKTVEAGYRRLIWFTYAEDSAHYSSQDRLEGIRRVARRSHISLEIVRYTQPGMGEERKRLMALLSPETAVLTEHMHFAQAVANATAEHGLVPGRDYGLTACDHSHERASVFPELSRVVIERTELGQKAAEMTLAALSGQGMPESVVFEGKWYAGNTIRRQI